MLPIFLSFRRPYLLLVSPKIYVVLQLSMFILFFCIPVSIAMLLVHYPYLCSFAIVHVHVTLPLLMLVFRHLLSCYSSVTLVHVTNSFSAFMVLYRSVTTVAQRWTGDPSALFCRCGFCWTPIVPLCSVLSSLCNSLGNPGGSHL